MHVPTSSPTHIYGSMIIKGTKICVTLPILGCNALELNGALQRGPIAKKESLESPGNAARSGYTASDFREPWSGHQLPGPLCIQDVRTHDMVFYPWGFN